MYKHFDIIIFIYLFICKGVGVGWRQSEWTNLNAVHVAYLCALCN